MKVERIASDQLPWLKIFFRFVLPGRPFILEAGWTAGWPSRQEWLKEGQQPDLELLTRRYGEARVPVVRERDEEVVEMTFRQYVAEAEGQRTDGAIYLKDWHFQKECNGATVYAPPPFLLSDWLNNETWTEDADNPAGGDYRFLYFGHPGTWTGFHSDVLSTHSWSANICGRKLWHLVPRGGESCFKQGRDYVRDIRTRRERWQEAGVVTFEQQAGEIVFVPSNHFHQVHNLETTISLNHNAINASNVQLVWEFLQRRVGDIREEIGHLEGIFDAREMEQQVQLILNADARLDYTKLSRLLQLVISSRSDSATYCYVCPVHPDPRSCHFPCFSLPCQCLSSTCDLCSQLLLSYELSIAIFVEMEVQEQLFPPQK